MSSSYVTATMYLYSTFTLTSGELSWVCVISQLLQSLSLCLQGSSTDREQGPQNELLYSVSLSTRRRLLDLYAVGLDGGGDRWFQRPRKDLARHDTFDFSVVVGHVLLT